jgi:hypothetical protein
MPTLPVEDSLVAQGINTKTVKPFLKAITAFRNGSFFA